MRIRKKSPRKAKGITLYALSRKVRNSRIDFTAETESITAAKPGSPDTHSLTLKVELKSKDWTQFPKREISVSPTRLLSSLAPVSALVQEVIETEEVSLTKSVAPASYVSGSVAVVMELASQDPDEESVNVEEMKNF